MSTTPDFATTGSFGKPWRPKKTPDLGKELIRELNLTLVINEGGKRSIIKKHQAFIKQLVNKSLAGHLPSTRLLESLYKEALEKEAEELRRVSEKAKRPLKE